MNTLPQAWDRARRLRQLRDNEIDLLTEQADLATEIGTRQERFSTACQELRETRAEIADLDVSEGAE